MYDPAMPTAAPAGETRESAVAAWVSMNACRNPSPGTATIQGGAKVSEVEHGRGHEHDRVHPSSSLMTSMTSR